MKGGVDRRSFLGGACALMATSALPSFGDDPSVFPNRGVFERLSTKIVRVAIGLPEPFSVMHFSDSHLTAAYDDEPEETRRIAKARTTTFGGRQEEALRDAIDWAKKNADYVLHTGDLVDFQSRANFDVARKYCGDMALACVGNHEYQWPNTYLKSGMSQEEFRAASRAPIAEAYGYDLTFRAKVERGVNFVMIDDAFGTVTEAQVARFAEEAKKGLPIVLCMHVPFFTPFILTAKAKFAKNAKGFDGRTPEPRRGDHLRQLNDPVTRGFIAHLKAQPILKAILTGHLHIGVEERFSPTAMQYVVAGNYMFHAAEILIT